MKELFNMRIITPLFSLLLLISCGKKEKVNMIYGQVNNLPKTWIYLQKITIDGDVTIDSVLTSGNGSFEMKNPATSPDFYILRTDPNSVAILILRENENVEITGDAINFEYSYQIKGSKDSELLKQFRKFEKRLSDSLNIAFEKQRSQNPGKKDSIGFLLQQHYAKTMEQFSKEFIHNNLNSLVSLSATKYVEQYANADLYVALRDTLIKTLRGNRYVDEFDLVVNQLNVLPPGTIAPEINLKTPEGKSLSLSSFKGKIVLINFWASWCAPCRRENPDLVELYEKYKGKDFEIFGVSLDENIDSWKNAILKDRIKWPQVSELKRWESEVVKQYQFSSIPYSILINRDGKIIYKGMQIEDIELRIDQAINS